MIARRVVDRTGWLGRLAERVRGAVLGRETVDESVYEALESVLLGADMGVETTERLIGRLREQVARSGAGPGQVSLLLRQEIATALRGAQGELHLPPAGSGPGVVLFVGVNGVGKTTTVAKVGHWLQSRGERVLLAAADTFRAAAAEQLTVWGQRLGVDVVRHASGADPAAVLFDAIQAARARGATVVLADTAGRQHTQANLMEELRKVARIAGRAVEGAPHAALLVLDATTGQNALRQAQAFAAAVPLSGVVLTKLDGTARGGVVLSIHAALGQPVLFLGTGESLGDLEPFDPDAFAAALFGHDA
jgi:fused signal recognition particle receptor